MSAEQREAVNAQAHTAEPGTLGQPDRAPEHGSPSPAAQAGAAALPGAHAPAAEPSATPARDHTIKVPPREDILGTRAAPPSRRPRLAGIAAGLLITLGLGWFGGMNAGRLAELDLPGRAVALAGAAARETRTWLQTAAEAGRVHGNRNEPAGATEGAAAETPGIPGELRAAQDPSRTDRGMADLAVKVDQVRAAFDGAAGDLAARLDQFRDLAERRNAELTAKLAQLEGQLGRVERQLAAASLTKAAQPETTALTSPAAAAAHRPAAAEKSAPKPAPDEAKAAEAKPVRNWRVREVLDGIAILEGPKGFIQVSRGDQVPGVGPVEAIQRRGKGWAVVTGNGVITSN